MKSQRTRHFFKIGAVIILALLATFISTRRAVAHAYLVRSEPAENAVLDIAPASMHLWFSETISPKFSSAQLLNAAGQIIAVETETSPSDPFRLIMQFPELADGVYSVRWTVLSETDGHFTQGLVVFGVGQGADLGTATAVALDTAVPWPEVILRWLNFTLTACMVGALAAASLVLNPGAHPQAVAAVQFVAQHRMMRLAWWCNLAALAVGLAWAVWQAVSLAGNLSGGPPILATLWQWLSQTRLGLLWWARLVVLLLLAAATWVISRTVNKLLVRLAPLIFLLLAALLLTQSLTSHAAALTANTALAIIVDTLHLLAVSVWVGGLLALVIGLLPLVRNRADFTTLVQAGWGPFGRMAAVSVGLTLATGLYSTGREVASADAMITTLYGQSLLVKIGLMLLVGLFGLTNSMLLHPRLAAPLARIFRKPAGWTLFSLRQLPRLVVIEAGLGIGVFLLAGLVTAVPTARAGGAPNENMPSTLSRTVDDVVISLTVSPNRPGQNIFTVRAASTRRPPPAEVLRVILRFIYLNQELGIKSVDAEEIEPGLYLIGGGELNLAGTWQIDTVVRRAGLEDSVAQFEWIVPQARPERPAIISNRPWEAALALAGAVWLLLVIGVTAVAWTIQSK